MPKFRDDRFAIGGKLLKGRFQWKAELGISATVERVWEIIDDISLIPLYHPEVGSIDLLSGQKKREVGVKYRCNILEGRKGSCVEEVVEYVPNQKMSTTFIEDSRGIGKMLAHFIVETTVFPKGKDSTALLLEAYYNPVGFRVSLLNPLLRRIMKKRTVRTMQGIKRLSERDP